MAKNSHTSANAKIFYYYHFLLGHSWPENNRLNLLNIKIHFSLYVKPCGEPSGIYLLCEKLIWQTIRICKCKNIINGQWEIACHLHNPWHNVYCLTLTKLSSINIARWSSNGKKKFHSQW